MPHGVDTTLLGGLLKENYADPNEIKDQVNLESKLWAKFSDSKFLGGGYAELGFRMAVRGEHVEGTTAINELEALPDALYNATRQILVPIKTVVHPVQFSGLSVEVAKGNAESFASTLDDTVTDARKIFIKRMNQMAYGYGKGEIATVNDATVSAETTFTVDNAQYLRPGMYIDIHATLGGTKEASGVKITGVNRSTNLVTVATAVTCSDDAIIVVKGTYDNAPTDGKEFQGLKGMIDTTTYSATYLGLSRSTYTWWQGTVVSASSAALSNDLLQKAANRVTIFTGKDAGEIIMHPNQLRNYLNIVSSQRRFADGKMDSGYTTLTWNDKALITDADCPTDEVYMLDFSTIGKYLTRPIHFFDNDGQVFVRKDGFNAFGALLRVYGNNACDYPASNVKITSLSDPGL